MADTTRVTLVFSASGFDWTETHWYMASGDILTAVPETNKLIDARAKLLGSNAAIIEARLSNDDVERDSHVIVPVNGPRYGPSIKLADNECDLPWNSLLFRAEAGVLRRKSIYVAGYPDVLSQGDRTPAIKTPSQFKTDMEKWIALLTSAKWGFRVRRLDPAEPAFKITNVLLDVANDHIGFESAQNTIAVGDIFQVTGTKVTALSEKVNHKYQCSKVAAGVTYSRTPYAAIPDVVKMGKIQKVSYTYAAYSDVILERLTERKRSTRSFFGVRGRSRTKR